MPLKLPEDHIPCLSDIQSVWSTNADKNILANYTLVYFFAQKCLFRNVVFSIFFTEIFTGAYLIPQVFKST